MKINIIIRMLTAALCLNLTYVVSAQEATPNTDASKATETQAETASDKKSEQSEKPKNAEKPNAEKPNAEKEKQKRRASQKLEQ